MKEIYKNKKQTIEIIAGQLQVKINNTPYEISFAKLQRDWIEMGEDQYEDEEDYKQGEYANKKLADSRTLFIESGTLKAKILEGKQAGQTIQLTHKEVMNWEDEEEIDED